MGRSFSDSMNSTMLKVKIDRQEPTELFEQGAAEIRRAIADGEAKPGERLPPARDLAAVLGVNTNTVLRSLRLLRDEGMLEFRRGRGHHSRRHARERRRDRPRARARPLRPAAGLSARRAHRAHRRDRLKLRLPEVRLPGGLDDVAVRVAGPSKMTYSGSFQSSRIGTPPAASRVRNSLTSSCAREVNPEVEERRERDGAPRSGRAQSEKPSAL